MSTEGDEVAEIWVLVLVLGQFGDDKPPCLWSVDLPDQDIAQEDVENIVGILGEQAAEKEEGSPVAFELQAGQDAQLVDPLPLLWVLLEYSQLRDDSGEREYLVPAGGLVHVGDPEVEHLH